MAVLPAFADLAHMKNYAIEPPPAFDPSVRLYHRETDFAVGGGARLLVIVWRDRTTLNGIRKCREYVHQTCSGSGCEFALMAVIEPKAKLPGGEERAAVAELLRDASRWIQVSTLAFEGNGFIAATIRSIVTGITLLAQQPFPHRVFENVEEASRFIEREQRVTNDSPFTARRVQAIVSELRRQTAA